MLLAAFIFLHFVSVIRGVLGSAESRTRGSAHLGRVAFAGALAGIAGMSMAMVTMAAASSEGTNANPVVSRAVTAAAAEPLLIAANGVCRVPDGRTTHEIPLGRASSAGIGG